MDVAITAVRSPAIVLGRPISASASARLSSTSRFSRELRHFPSHLNRMSVPRLLLFSWSHPHLVPAAVDQQLEQLQTDRNADQQKEEPSASGMDFDFVQEDCRGEG